MSLPDGRQVIAFDFDGVLHDYHGWNGGTLAGPLPGMLYLVDQLRAEGAYVVIHTTRKAEDIAPWLAKHGFPDLPVYHEKWQRIDVFVDDRAVRYTPERTSHTGVPKRLRSRRMSEGDLEHLGFGGQEKLKDRDPLAAEFIPAVQCRVHGYVPLDLDEYVNQLEKPDELWRCPVCGDEATWAGNE